MVLPSGSTVPPLPQAAVLVVAVAATAWALRRDRVGVDDRTVVALSPWMVAGATLYVLYQVAALPSLVAPFFGSPAVYATTFVIAGATWLLARRTGRPLSVLAGTGVVAALVPTAIAVAIGLANGTFAPVVPLLAVALGAALAAGAWIAYRRIRPRDAESVGLAGPVVILAHALDGVSTAVGVDVLGFAERTPLSRLVMEAAGALPTADVIGVGWLFVAVKVALAAVVLSTLAGYVRDEPTEGNALLTVVAAVGLGPAAHNVLLFAVLGPAGF
ncbi:MAG: DUF63 family protein [Halanaeroarchaeum sp.]